MSNTDSFIDEVNEEIRNDQLYAVFRKYAWVGALVIVGVVGGAVTSEYLKSSRLSDAQAAGDALSDALQASSASERAAALGAVADTYDNAAFIAEIARANELAEVGSTEDALASLEAAKAIAPQTPTFQDMIVLKMVLLTGVSEDPAEAIEMLSPLTAIGRPYRLLALEQTGYAQLAAGDVEAALTSFETVSQDAETTAGLRERSEQMITALGGNSSE